MNCTATTKRGKPCRSNAIAGTDRCSVHRRHGPDAEAVTQLVAMLRAGNYLEVAARAAGVELADVAAIAELVDEVETARAEGEVRAIARIAAAAADNWQAAAWLLERSYPDRWGRPAQRAVDEAPPPLPIVDGLDELAGRRDARRAVRR